VIDAVRDNEDGVERELGTTRTFGAEEDDRAAGEIAQLGRAVLRVLEAAGVVKPIAEDERVGVVESAVRGLVGPSRAMDPEWSVQNARADRLGLRWGLLAPERPSPQPLSRRAGREALGRGIQVMLSSGMEILDEAELIVHRAPRELDGRRTGGPPG
jgi:hypothetical protein